jgi:hypothetical protein
MTKEVNARKEWFKFLREFYSIKNDKTLKGSDTWSRITPRQATEIKKCYVALLASIQSVLVGIPKLELRFEHSKLESLRNPGSELEVNAFSGTANVFVVRSYNEYKALQVANLSLPNSLRQNGEVDALNIRITRLRESWFRLNRGCFGDCLTAKDTYPKVVVCQSNKIDGIFSSGYVGFGRFAHSTDLTELRSSVMTYATRLVLYRNMHNWRREDAAWSAMNFLENPMQQHMLDAFLKTNYLENHAFNRRALRAAKKAVRGSEDS